MRESPFEVSNFGFLYTQVTTALEVDPVSIPTEATPTDELMTLPGVMHDKLPQNIFGVVLKEVIANDVRQLSRPSIKEPLLLLDSSLEDETLGVAVDFLVAQKVLSRQSFGRIDLFGLSDAALKILGLESDDSPTTEPSTEQDPVLPAIKRASRQIEFDPRTDRRCQDPKIDREIFYPPPDGSFRLAKRVCEPCVFKEKCLEEALKRREAYGVWGGKSPRERRKILKARKITLLEEADDE